VSWPFLHKEAATKREENQSKLRQIKRGRREAKMKEE
jgi:hypothetical protein